MLLQSHLGYIELLPALPKAWQKGFVRGLKARGAFVVDMEWAEGKLVRCVIRSEKGGLCKIYSKKRLNVLCDGKPVSTIYRNEELEFPTQKGRRYLVLPKG